MSAFEKIITKCHLPLCTLSSSLSFPLRLFLVAAGGTIQRRAVLPHDEIVGFPETVPDNNIGQLYLRFKPHLFVANGCVPFPAVDAEGNTR